MVYSNCRIYGPYLNKKDNRLRIFVVRADGTKTTVSYPKYLVELNIGRYLEKDETVDHIDCNPLNNDLSNLRVLSRSEHSKLDASRIQEQEGICPNCGNPTVIKSLAEQRRGKAVGFCSRKCSGLYGKKVQLNSSNRIKTNYNSKYKKLKN